MEQTKLGDIVSFMTGKLNSNAAKPDGEFPFFTCSQETFKTDTYSFDTECVLLGGNNANGIYPLKYYSGKFDAYQRTYVIRTLDNKKLINRYLFYALHPKLDLLKSISTGAATKFLTLTILKALDIELPSLKVQHKIASILSAYDDLIENNNRRIKILEEMAQAIYKEWFVNFRFPGHKKVKMVKSKLGMIPEVWEETTLEHIVEQKKHSIVDGPFGTQMKVSEYVTEGIPVIEMPYLEGCYFYKNFQNFITEEKYQKVKRSTAERDDIILSKTGTLGLLGIVPSTIDRAIIVSRLAKLSPSRILRNKYFIFFTLKKHSDEGYWNTVSSGSTMPMLNLGHIKSIPVISPPSNINDMFNDIIDPIYQKIRIHLIRNNILRKTRDLLLPKLISGEIDVEKLDIQEMEAFQ